MRSIALRINASMAGVVVPGLVAGVIYFAIAFASGATTGASVIGGIVVAAAAVIIGSLFRVAYKRRAMRTHR